MYMSGSMMAYLGILSRDREPLALLVLDEHEGAIKERDVHGDFRLPEGGCEPPPSSIGIIDRGFIPKQNATISHYQQRLIMYMQNLPATVICLQDFYAQFHFTGYGPLRVQLKGLYSEKVEIIT